MVAKGTVASSFLTDGISDGQGHRKNLLKSATGFRRLIAARAGGLHAGRGLLHETTVVQANSVADFLELLGESRRLHPYLERIPRCLWYSKDRTLLIEDLRNRLSQPSADDKVQLLSSLYLVLPDVPEEEPEWLAALERVAVAPQNRDVEYLLDTLERALPASLRRTTDATGTVPVRIATGDPAALPIAPQFLRRQFNQIPELWHSDIATANGRLSQKVLDLPPAEAVQDVFALGLERAAVLNSGEHLSAHQAWPHIVSSFNKPGTVGPYWFLVRRCEDLGQLTSLLNQAIKIRKKLAESLAECLHGIDVLSSGETIGDDDKYFIQVISETKHIQSDLSWLIEVERKNRGTLRALPEELQDVLKAVAEGGEPVGKLLSGILDSKPCANCLVYWPRVLAENSSVEDDVPSLIALLRTADASAGHTAARKALRRIDFALHGPPVKEN